MVLDRFGADLARTAPLGIRIVASYLRGNALRIVADLVVRRCLPAGEIAEIEAWMRTELAASPEGWQALDAEVLASQVDMHRLATGEASVEALTGISGDESLRGGMAKALELHAELFEDLRTSLPGGDPREIARALEGVWGPPGTPRSEWFPAPWRRCCRCREASSNRRGSTARSCAPGGRRSCRRPRLFLDVSRMTHIVGQELELMFVFP
jgi:hypothetical protein